MFDIFYDITSATSSGCIGRMNSTVGYVILESNKRFCSEMRSWYETYVNILCAKDYF
jgi:hypothetical protein